MGEKIAENAAWCYEQPVDEVATIGGLIAFYVDVFDAVEEQALAVDA